jgi:hypothetical protein
MSLLSTSRPVAITATASLAIVAGALATSAATTSPDPCPEPFPAAELVDGLAATGYTVERGNTADPFTATVIGVIDNGIAPDIDMILVEVASSALERAGGVWSGMSGSPVYAADGRLIGAVAYGLSFAPSNVAGLTPAEDMKRLVTTGQTLTGEAQEVDIPATLQDELIDAELLSADEAEGGFRQLSLPTAVSGVNGSRLRALSERVAGPHTRTYLAGAAADGETGDVGEIFPGSNVAAAMSYGDVTMAGVGTTTAVCDDEVLAFGHPFLWTGSSSMSMHSAQAVHIQPDGVFGPFKVANPKAIVGTLDQDRLAGIRGRLGDGPATVPVSSQVSTSDGRTRAGTTQVTMPDYLADLSMFHLLSNLDRVQDRVGKGTSHVQWDINGTRADGRPFAVRAANAYSSQSDVAFDSVFDLFEQLWAIRANEHEEVEITAVDVTAELSSELTRYSLGEVLVNGDVPGSEPVEIASGADVVVSVSLLSYQGRGPDQQVELTLNVPSELAGSSGWLTITGGRSGTPDDGVDEPASTPGTGSFDDLIEELESLPPNNAVAATLTVEDFSDDRWQTVEFTDRAVVDHVVSGDRTFLVAVNDQL